jgi:predicted metalloprotease with PDZ domain
LRDRGSALEVGSVVEGSPAQEAGLGGGDEVVALDGFRGDIKARLSRKEPGDTVRLSFFRMDELLHKEVRLLDAPNDTVTLSPSASAGETELRLREGWLGGTWP